MSKVGAVWRFVVDVALRWYHGGVGDLAAGVVFWILVSLPASILALLAALGWLESFVSFSISTDVEESAVQFVNRVFTDESGGIEDAVRTLFAQNNPSLLTVSLAVALWSMSRGFAGLLRSLDDIYGIENGRRWYHTRVVALALGLGSLLVVVPLVVLERVLWSAVPDAPVVAWIRSMMAMVVLVLWAQTIYHFGPSQRSRWLHDLPGAVVAAVLWWLLSVGFGFYVSLTASANGVTAAVGAGLLALTWLWIAAQVLLIGGVVNFQWAERFGIDRHPQTWGLNQKLRDSTGELRRIVSPPTVADQAVDHAVDTAREVERPEADEDQSPSRKVSRA